MRTSPDYRLVKQTAKDLLSQFGLIEPPINPVDIAEALGIEVKFANFGGNFYGVSGFYDPDETAIYVNKEEPALRQTFTIAHELGHHLLHQEWAGTDDYKVFWRDMSRNSDDMHEKEANAFAGNLLVPRFMLDRYYPRLSKPDLSKLFAVSVPVINTRLSMEYGV